MLDLPFAQKRWLLARAVMVLDREGVVRYFQLVKKIGRTAVAMRPMAGRQVRTEPLEAISVLRF